jgi:hypothetical protein
MRLSECPAGHAGLELGKGAGDLEHEACRQAWSCRSARMEQGSSIAGYIDPATGALAGGPTCGICSLLALGRSPTGLRDPLLDHFVSGSQQDFGDRQVERLRGFQIEDKCQLGGSLNR